MKNSKTKIPKKGSMRGKNISTGASRAGFIRLWDFVWISGSVAAVLFIVILLEALVSMGGVSI